MASRQDILDTARKLGEMIAETDAAQKMEDAVKKLQEDTQAQRALNDYTRHLQTLAEKEQQGQPIEVSDKKKLQELQTVMIRNPLLRELQVAQMDYVDLMREVDEAISPPGADLPGPASGMDLAGT